MFLLGVAASFVGVTTYAAVPTTSTREVDTGYLIVDGDYLSSPLTVVYGLDPPGVYIGERRVLDDPGLYDRVGFVSEPPLETMGGNEAWLGDRRAPPATGAGGRAARRLAAQVVEQLLRWRSDGLSAAGILDEFGRFLWREADVDGADIQGSTVEMYLDVEGHTHLSATIDSVSLHGLSQEVDRALRFVADAAGGGGVFEHGTWRGADTVSPALRDTLLRRGDRVAASWLRALWAASRRTTFGASVIRTALPDVALALDSVSADIVVLHDAAGRIALFADDAPIDRVRDALAPTVDLSVAPSAQGTRVRFRSSAFEDPDDAVAAVSAAAGLRLDGRRWTSHYDEDALRAGGRRLWRSESPLAYGGRWVVPAPDACLLSVPGGAIGIRWSNGKLRWRWPGGAMPHAPVVTPDGKIAFFATATGAVAGVEIRSGRVLWSVFPAHRQSILRADLPPMRIVGATNSIVLVARGEDELLVLDRGSSAVRARHEASRARLEGTVPRSGLAVAWKGARYGFDKSGALVVAVPGAVAAGDATDEIAATGRPVGDRFVFEHGSTLLITTRALQEVKRVSGDHGPWTSRRDVLVVADRDAVRIYSPVDANPVAVPIAAPPYSLVMTDTYAWVVTEGGIAYGVDTKAKAVRRHVDMGDVVSVHGFGVGAIGLTEEATATGWKLN